MIKAMLGTPLSSIRRVPVAGKLTGVELCQRLSPGAFRHFKIGRCRCSSSSAAERPPPAATNFPTSHVVEQEFAELNLKSISEQVGGIRTRQHVNPLTASLMVPVSPPTWKDIFTDPSLPIAVDIGCGSGRFLMMMAKKNSEAHNYLGLEIRQKLVFRANLWVKELRLENLHFIFANATVSFGVILSTYPGPLKLVTILCPDPHFKKKHHKRRVVQMQLVDAIVDYLAPGGKVFLQSDVKEVAEDMRCQFDTKVGVALTGEHHINPSTHDSEGWLLENPLGIRTEREIHAVATGGTLYRNLYTKSTHS